MLELHLELAIKFHNRYIVDEGIKSFAHDLGRNLP